MSSLSLILRENTTDISSYVLRGKGDSFKRNSEIRTKEVPLSRKKRPWDSVLRILNTRENEVFVCEGEIKMCLV